MLHSLRLCAMCRSRAAPRVSMMLRGVSPRFASSSSKPKQPKSNTPASSSSSTAGPQAPPHDLKEVVDLLRAYESRYTYRGWHILRLVGIAGITGIGLVAYFWENVLKIISREGSELAQQTMQDKELQQEIDRITSQTTNTLLNDPQTVQVTLDFLMRLLQKPQTRHQVVEFFSKVLTDTTTVQALSQLLRDPVTLRQLQSSLNTLLNDPTIRASLNKLVFNLLQDPQTQRLLENLVMDLLQRPNVKESTADFFGQVLRYPQVIDAATASSRNVVENLSKDEEVHKNLATAGTSALTRMVVPGWLLRNHNRDEDKDVEIKEETVEVEENDNGKEEITVEEAEEYVEDEDSSGLDIVEEKKAAYRLPSQ